MGKSDLSERDIQDKLIVRLRGLQWSVRETHGNMYQRGFPDLFCAHARYGIRWIEVKRPDRTGSMFTPSQISYFQELGSVNVGVWVLTGSDDSEIAKLFKDPNWYVYLRKWH